jgi:mannosyltransferase
MRTRSPATATLGGGLDDGAIRERAIGSLAVDLALVSAVAVVLGLIRLGTPSLWVDESFTAQAVRGHLLNPEDQYHWLYYAAITPWTLVAGTSELALRLPSVVASAVACALLVVLARPLFGRRVALVGGLFLATSPFVVQWSQQARSYSFVLAAGVLATLLLLRAIAAGSRAAWTWYGLGLTLVFVLQPVSALVLVPAHVVLGLRERKAVLPHGLLAVCLVIVLGIPWAFFRARQTPVDNWLERPSLEVAGRALLDISGAFGVGLALAIIGIVMLRRQGRGGDALWLGTWAFAPFALALAASFIRPVFLDRYLITAAPAFALLAAAALFAVSRRVAGVLVAVAVVATVAGLAHWYSFGGNNWRGEGWRNAVATAERRAGPGDAIVVVPWWAAPAATYYGGQVVDTSTADSVWVLRWSEDGGGIARSERRLLGFGDHHLVERHDFGWRVSAQLWRR